MRFGVMNLLDCDPFDPAKAARFAEIGEVLTSGAAHVWAVTEVMATGRRGARRAMSAVARRAGMVCGVGWGRAAVAFSGETRHVGLMWDPAVAEFVAGSFRSSGLGFHNHVFARVILRIGGVDMQFGSTHLEVFSRFKRVDQSSRLVGAVTRPQGCLPAFVGMDANGPSAARRRCGEYYDSDRHAAAPWHPDYVYQVDRTYDDAGNIGAWREDRSASQQLVDGGLFDAAAVLDVPWQPTEGHWPGDPHPSRRVIQTWTTVPGAIAGYEVVTGGPADTASDHHATVTTIDLPAVHLSLSRHGLVADQTPAHARQVSVSPRLRHGPVLGDGK
jgi:endonuclease/exonuclease/phosphatase family metal-dependent hydrolase